MTVLPLPAQGRGLMLAVLLLAPPLGAQGLVIGEPGPPPEVAAPERTAPFPLKELRLEAGLPVRNGPVSAVHYLHGRL